MIRPCRSCGAKPRRLFSFFCADCAPEKRSFVDINGWPAVEPEKPADFSKHNICTCDHGRAPMRPETLVLRRSALG